MIPLPPYAFLAGAPGAGEWVVLFLAILILFGPRRLPEIARTIGRMLEQIRRASSEFKDQVMQIAEFPPIDVSFEAGGATPHPDALDGDEGEGRGDGEDPEQGDVTDADSAGK